MGTSNFHYENCFFAITEGDEWTWDDTRSNIMHELSKDRDWIASSDLKIESELRSFHATSIGIFQDYLYFGQEEITISVIAMTRSGYYEGFNLDYEVSITNGYSDYEDSQELWDDMYEYTPSIRGVLTVHKESLKKMVDERVETFTDRLEEVYKMFSDEYNTVGRFSDGTSLIEKVS